MKKNRINVVFVTSEIKPLSHTGGLSDVSFSLPDALLDENVNIIVFTPQYKSVLENNPEISRVSSNLSVPILNYNRPFNLNKTLINNKIQVYLVENNELFERDGLYGNEEGDYPDNAERFVFFSKAVLTSLKEMNLVPDVIHCNDWQTALIPVYLRNLYKDDPFWENTKTLFTIHNIGYQGLFWHFDLPLTGLSWDIFTIEGIEFYGKINLMKGGIVFSDKISTVSKRYAQEIQTEEYGNGLDGIIRVHENKLDGILNGVDYNEWNPETDEYIKKNYKSKSLKGKEICKKDLMGSFSLSYKKDRPLLGIITRLTDQKGIHLLIEALKRIFEEDSADCVILGSGDKEYETALTDLKNNYPNSLGLKLGYDFALSHKITAGADIFLMPSIYEPCGLNQMYSLKYGTIPVVRSTGGLDDTIESVSLSGKNLTGTGFKFQSTKSEDFIHSIKEAISYYKQKKYWEQIVKNGMMKDFSWKNQAKEYVEIYKKLKD